MPQFDKCALVIVDVQKGFDDLSYWSTTGRRNDPPARATPQAHLSSRIRTATPARRS
jgi:hypothetical protein